MISIIIPLYNQEKYIIRCISSILLQSYENFEIIIVNDGSSDNSVDLVKSISDRRVRLINKKNGGVSSARNKGLENANGKWIMFLDADDELADGALEKLHKATLKYDYVQVIVGNYQVKDSLGNKRIKSKLKKEKLYDNPLIPLCFRSFYSRPGNTLISTKVVRLVGLYDETISYNEDLDFTIRLFLQCKVLYIPETIMFYNLADNTASTKVHELNKDYLSKIDSISKSSIFENFIILELLEFGLLRRKGDNSWEVIKEIKKRNFGPVTCSIFVFFKICRKIKNIIWN